jgi:adenosine/AMP kinase
MLELGAGHAFLVLLRGTYPVNVLQAIMRVPEVCQVFCATANPVQVVVAEPRLRIPSTTPRMPRPWSVYRDRRDVAHRRVLLRELGYKLG